MKNRLRQVYTPIYLFCCSSVNIFMLLSGYMGIRSKFRYSRIVSLFLQVAFWSLGIDLIFKIFFPGIESGQSIIHFIPLFTQYYWFFTSYLVLFFAMPGLNCIVENMPVIHLKHMLWAFFVIFSLLTRCTLFGYHNFRGGEALMLNNGYSPLWLGYVYLLGAAISKYGISQLLPKFLTIAGRFAIAKLGYAVTILSVLFFAYLAFRLHPILARHIPFLKVFVPAHPGAYIAPCTVALAVLVFYCAKQIQYVALPSLVSFCAVRAFGVFVIHCQFHILEYVITGYFTWIKVFPYLAVPYTILVSLGIFAICVLLDFLREKLFAAMAIPQLTRRLCGETIIQNMIKNNVKK